MNKDMQEAFEQFVDFLIPSLTPYEATIYVILFRNSYLKEALYVRIGKRTLADRMGATRGTKTAYAHITKLVTSLEEKGCLKIGDTNREGTRYEVFLPKDIPLVQEKLAVRSTREEEDYFTDPEKRKEIFERDDYTCFYCGERVTSDNATLDHLIPQHKGGKTYEEAAPLLLKNIRERRS
jgi:hypothetical protein